MINRRKFFPKSGDCYNNYIAFVKLVQHTAALLLSFGGPGIAGARRLYTISGGDLVTHTSTFSF